MACHFFQLTNKQTQIDAWKLELHAVHKMQTTPSCSKSITLCVVCLKLCEHLLRFFGPLWQTHGKCW